MAEQGPWESFVDGLGSDTEFAPGASEAEIAAAEKALGVRFPAELRSLLLEGDGLQDEDGAGAIWSAEDIAEQNLSFRREEGFREL